MLIFIIIFIAKASLNKDTDLQKATCKILVLLLLPLKLKRVNFFEGLQNVLIGSYHHRNMIHVEDSEP